MKIGKPENMVGSEELEVAYSALFACFSLVFYLCGYGSCGLWPL